MESPVPNDWTTRLTDAVADSLREFSREVAPLAAVDLGCFPWHGRLELSALTVHESEADPALLDPSEAAAWRHYNFAERMPPWGAAANLGREMRKAYEVANDTDRASTVAAFLRACATAVGSPAVATAIRGLPRTRLTVCHPETGEVFWPPVEH